MWLGKSRWMASTLTAIMAFSSLSLDAFAADKLIGLKHAKAKSTLPRKDIASSQAGKDTVQTCYAFAEFSVVEVDSGKKGADSIVVRRASSPSERKKACDTQAWPSELRLADHEQYFYGATDNYLVTVAADGSGALKTLWIYDATSGKLVHEAKYNATQNFSFKTKGKALALEYYRLMDVACSLKDEAQSCWDSVLAANQVAKDTKIAAPVCEWKKLPVGAKDNLATQVFAKVRVEDVAASKVVFQSGRALCALAP